MRVRRGTDLLDYQNKGCYVPVTGLLVLINQWHPAWV
jgi:hypothetical protein